VVIEHFREWCDLRRLSAPASELARDLGAAQPGLRMAYETVNYGCALTSIC
jgi:hypothetical protein